MTGKLTRVDVGAGGGKKRERETKDRPPACDYNAANASSMS
jgi:hypothetical protein